MNNNIYSHEKVHYHLDKLLELKKNKQPYPVRVQLIPENACNHNCSFCAYRSANGFNKQGFDEKKRIPWIKMLEILYDCKQMGVKAIEITGGGEPLLYKHIIDLFKKIKEYNIDHSLITNGVLLTEKVAENILEQMSWCRVSIDAGSASTYSKIRNVDPNQYYTVLKNISNIKKYAKNPEFRLGAGFVVCNDNSTEVYEFVKTMVEHGLDLVRIGLIFHDNKLGYFNKDILGKLEEDIARVKNDFDKYISIFDTTSARLEEITSGSQDYSFCGMQHLGTMIGADQKVYTCCILCYNKKGLLGDISDKGFKKLWDSDEKKKRMLEFNPSKVCNYMCLYEKKNKYIYSLLKEKPLHKNFL